MTTLCCYSLHASYTTGVKHFVEHIQKFIHNIHQVLGWRTVKKEAAKKLLGRASSHIIGNEWNEVVQVKGGGEGISTVYVQ